MCRCTDPLCRSGCGCLKNGYKCARQCACGGYCPNGQMRAESRTVSSSPSSSAPATQVIFVPVAASPASPSPSAVALMHQSPLSGLGALVLASSNAIAAAPPLLYAASTPPAIAPAQQALLAPPPPAAAAPQLPAVGMPTTPAQTLEHRIFEEFYRAWVEVKQGNPARLTQLLHGDLQYRVNVMSSSGSNLDTSSNPALDGYSRITALVAILQTEPLRRITPMPHFSQSEVADPRVSYRGHCIFEGFQRPGELQLHIVLRYVQDLNRLMIFGMIITCLFQ